jgi:S1-C subfamily serine protease
MKKILITLILLFTFTGGYVVADSLNGSFEGNPIVKLFSGGKELTVSDVPAINYHDRTMVPIYLLNQLGVTTKWNGDSQSVDIMLPEKVKIVHPTLTQEKLNEIAKSVYEIFGTSADLTRTSQGSAFIVNDTMVTNYHVSGDSAYTQVQMNGQMQNISKDKYLFANKTNDVMGFKVTGGTSLPYSTVLPEKDDIVYAIGYPADKLLITEGTVQNVFDLNGKQKVVQHNAKTEPGSSGGALINDKGEVIGITYSGDLINGKYVDFAIPISYVLQELK